MTAADDDAAPSLDEDEEPQPANAADPASHKRIRDRAKRERAEAAEFWRGVFLSEVGRREMWAILNASGAFRERFANGPNGFPQPEATWAYSGEQRMGFRLYLTWLGLCPDHVAVMLKEHHPALAVVSKPRRASKERG